MADVSEFATLPFLVEVPPEITERPTGTKSMTRRPSVEAEATVETRGVPVDKLHDNLRQACQGIAQVFHDLREVGGMKLKEVTVQVEVSAEGGVSFIGTSKLGGKGAITLKFGE